jgi:hypothetical protein
MNIKYTLCTVPYQSLTLYAIELNILFFSENNTFIYFFVLGGGYNRRDSSAPPSHLLT